MIDHVSLAVRDLKSSGRLYERMLAPLGLALLVTRENSLGLGKRYPELWLNHRPDLVPARADSGFHVCLRAREEAVVRAFFDIALDEGCLSAGAPGRRQGAMTEYYAAFIRDPDGNKIEAASFPAA